ncbi:MAG: trypsin-like serine protease, partial [Anaerolineales bacterium]
ELVTASTGSGFVIDKDGHIVTNAHVVDDADALQVAFSDGDIASADVLGVDPYSDLAVIRVDVERDRLVPLELGDSISLRVGQRVIAIGNPFGLRGTMTLGVVSALDRGLPSATEAQTSGFQNPDIIQTDAALNSGNSGGPLLDARGRVVGVASAILAPSGYSTGVGFAIPADTVKRVVPALISDGVYHYSYLGIRAETTLRVAEMAEPLGLSVTRGVLVGEVHPGTGAEQAGLIGGDHEVSILGVSIRAGGDVIAAIDSHELRDFDDLVLYLVRETEVGQVVALTIVRGGEKLEVDVTLGERP